MRADVAGDPLREELCLPDDGGFEEPGLPGPCSRSDVEAASAEGSNLADEVCLFLAELGWLRLGGTGGLSATDGPAFLGGAVAAAF